MTADWTFVCSEYSVLELSGCRRSLLALPTCFLRANNKLYALSYAKQARVVFDGFFLYDFVSYKLFVSANVI